MSTKDEILKAAKGFKDRLLDLGAQAFRNEDMAAADLAKALVAKLNGLLEKPTGTQEPKKPAAEPKRKKRRKRRSRKKAGYPRFYLQGDDLVKVGYSRKKGEYRHRVPKESVDLVVAAIDAVGKDETLFTAEDFMPVEDKEHGVDVPSYQAYQCLAWLRTEGLVEAQGRQGYRLAALVPLPDGAEARWHALHANPT